MKDYRDLANHLRTEASIVKSHMTDSVSRYSLRDTVPRMIQAAKILEEISSIKPITRVKIVTARETAIEGNINETLQDLSVKYENLDILKIDVQDVNSITVRAVITYRYTESTRS